MEEALARLYALMSGLPETPGALSDYGAGNRIFVERIGALTAGAMISSAPSGYGLVNGSSDHSLCSSIFPP
jgi:hypothetical protein